MKTIHPITFIDKAVKKNELGKTSACATISARCSCIKKSGKTIVDEADLREAARRHAGHVQARE